VNEIRGAIHVDEADVAAGCGGDERVGDDDDAVAAVTARSHGVGTTAAATSTQTVRPVFGRTVRRHSIGAIAAATRPACSGYAASSNTTAASATTGIGDGDTRDGVRYTISTARPRITRNIVADLSGTTTSGTAAVDS